MLIHNFLVDEREDSTEVFSNFNVQRMYEDSDIIGGNTREAEQLLALVMENDADRPPGWPVNFSAELRKAGIATRDNIALYLYGKDLRRPKNPGWKRNAYGHVYYVGNTND
jgi:hypothetical protein